MKKLLYLCSILLLSMNTMAQQNHLISSKESSYCQWHKKLLDVEYHQDCIPFTPGWRYDSIHSDEFDSININGSKWSIPNEAWHSPNTAVGFVNFRENIRTEDGKLFLSVTANNDSIQCYCSWDTIHPYIIPKLLTARLFSSYKQYGYFETECYLPKNHNIWPCFWLYRRNTSVKNYDEVDVFERTSTDNTNHPNIIRQNCYSQVDYPDESKITQVLTFPDSITGKSSVFGVEILPEEVVFYINGHVSSHLRYNESITLPNIKNTFTCTDIVEMIPMHVLLTLTCDPTQTTIPLPNESTWFEYARCYKLERGCVETYHPTIFTPTNESTKVYPHIILGGTGCSANVNTATAIWAEQDIILDKGFELSAGTRFSARVISVPDPEHSPLYN